LGRIPERAYSSQAAWTAVPRSAAGALAAGLAEAGVGEPGDRLVGAVLVDAGGEALGGSDDGLGGFLGGPVDEAGLVERAEDGGDGPEGEVVGFGAFDVFGLEAESRFGGGGGHGWVLLVALASPAMAC
jgi:hypothetical protein